MMSRSLSNWNPTETVDKTKIGLKSSKMFTQIKKKKKKKKDCVVDIYEVRMGGTLRP